MQKSGYEIWKPYKKLGQLIFMVAFVMLFFAPKIDLAIYNWLPHTAEPSLIGIIRHIGLNTSKLLLYLMNFGLWPTVVSPLKQDDERIEKIRNFVYQLTFRSIIMMAMFTGLLLKENFSLLIFVLIMQGMYLILFRIAVYRDSSIAYLSLEQLMAHEKKRIKEKKRLKVFIISSIILSCAFALVQRYYPTYYTSFFVIIINLAAFLGAIKMIWDNETTLSKQEPSEISS